MAAGTVIALAGAGTAAASARPGGHAAGARAGLVNAPASPGTAGAGPVPASVSRIGSWPSASAAVCHFVDIIGARGSGEPAGGKFGGLGPPVHKMISVIQGDLKKAGFSYSAFALNYPALSVDVLKPSSTEVAAWISAPIDPAGAIAALVVYYDHQVKKYLASIKAGVTAAVSKAKSLHHSCGATLLVMVGYSQGAMVVHQALVKLSGAVANCVKGAVLLADGNRVKNTRAMRYGTSLARGEGIQTWIKQTAKVGPTAHDVPRYAAGNTASICNKSDYVCDFNFFTGIHWKRGFTVHTSYAVKHNNGSYTYQPVLSRAASAVGGNVVHDLQGHLGSCS
jgi:hypothetical protein